MANSSPVADDCLRILLIGRTGHGKSSTGNTILGEDVFKVEKSPTSVTRTCHYEKRFRLGRWVEVVDTPGLFDTNLSNEDVLNELINSLAYTMPGFHAIVFVLGPDRFTNELVETKKLFFEWFGGNVENYALMILTHSQNKEEVDSFFDKNTNSDLTELRERCGKTVLPFENDTEKSSAQSRDAQVQELFNHIEWKRKQTGTDHFTNLKFKVGTIYIGCYKLISDIKTISKTSIRALTEAAGLTREDLKELDANNDGENIRKTHEQQRSGNLFIIDESTSQVGIYFDEKSIKDENACSSDAIDYEMGIDIVSEMSEAIGLANEQDINESDSYLDCQNDRHALLPELHDEVDDDRNHVKQTGRSKRALRQFDEPSRRTNVIVPYSTARNRITLSAGQTPRNTNGINYDEFKKDYQNNDAIQKGFIAIIKRLFRRILRFFPCTTSDQ